MRSDGRSDFRLFDKAGVTNTSAEIDFAVEQQRQSWFIAVMNVIQHFEYLPSADMFVWEVVRRVHAGYPKAIVPITKAIAHAGASGPEMILFTRNPISKAIFLLGCAAEEVAALEEQLDDKQGKAFIRGVVEHLKPHARPIKAKRVSPEFRRLLSQFRNQPSRTRLQTVQLMLEANGLEFLNQSIALDPVVQLAIECSVTVDGISGCLMDLLPHGDRTAPQW